MIATKVIRLEGRKRTIVGINTKKIPFQKRMNKEVGTKINPLRTSSTR